MGGRARRIFLLSILAFVSVSAILCSVLALSNTWYWATDSAVRLGLTIAYFTVLILGATTGLGRPIVRVFSILGILTAIFAMGFVTLIILNETFESARSLRLSMRPHVGDWMLTSIFTASLICLSSWVLTPRMKPLGQIVQVVSVILMVCCYLSFIIRLWNFIHIPRGVRLDIVFGLLGGVSTLNVFILCQFFGLKVRDPLSAFDQLLFLRCPRCSKEQEVSMGDSRCGGCDLRFNIDVEDPKCSACRYNLRGFSGGNCPECGKAIMDGAVGLGVVGATPL